MPAPKDPKNQGHPWSDEELEQLWIELGSTKKVAKATGYSESHCRYRLAEIVKRHPAQPIVDVDRAERIRELILSVPREIDGGGKIKQLGVGLHGMGAKNEFTQEITTQGLDNTKAVYSFSGNSALPLVDRTAPIVIKYPPVRVPCRNTKVYAVIPDAQIGWLKDPETSHLTPIHDPTAMDVAKQIVRAVSPDGLIFIGDWVDWQFLSKWRQFPEYDAANPSIETGTLELAEFCSAAGPTAADHRIMIGSNHADRPELWVIDRNMAAAGIRRGGDTSAWPVFSEQYLLRYDDLNIQFSGHFGSVYWLTERLAFTHAPTKPREFDADVFHGHDHKLKVTPAVIHGAYGKRNIRFIWDSACLCRVDANTDKRRLMGLNVPSNSHRTDWIQGMLLVEVFEGSHAVYPIHIDEGRALYRGTLFEASDASRDLLAKGKPCQPSTKPD
jgi:hypothetical protein